MFKKLSILALMGVMLFTTSCGTLFTGTKDTISFNSNPKGAKVYIDGIEVCKTPCTVKVKRSLSDKLTEIKLDGYQTRVITLDKEFNIVSVLNLTNLIGWAIDAVTGSVMKYDRKSYDIELEKDKKVGSLLKNPKKINIDTENKKVEVYVMK